VNTGANSFSRCFWYNPSRTGSENQNTLSSKNCPMWFAQTNYLNVAFNFNSNPGATPYITDNVFRGTGVWTHYVLTFDATLGIGTLYINGSLFKSVTPSPAFVENGPLQINWYLSGNAGIALYDNIHLYNRALTASEVSSMYNYELGNPFDQSITTVPAQIQPATTSGTIYARYTASNYNATTNIWADSTGNGRNIPSAQITSAGLSFVTTTANSNGSIYSFTALQGTTSSSIQFTNTSLSQYTLFTVARWVGTTNKRIFTGSTINWLSGFWAGYNACAYHGDPDTVGWITNNSTNVYGNNWIISTDSSSLYRGNGVSYNNKIGGTTNLPPLSINSTKVYNEPSDFQVVDVLIYDSYLSRADIIIVENFLANLYGITLTTTTQVGSAAIQQGIVQGSNPTWGGAQSTNYGSSWYIWNIANADLGGVNAVAQPLVFMWFYYKFYYRGVSSSCTIYIQIDNDGYFYFNAVNYGDMAGGWGANSNGNIINNVPLISNSWNYIRIPAYNMGTVPNPAAIIVAIYDGNNTLIAVTDNTWRWILCGSSITASNYYLPSSDPIFGVFL
jgi:hypothetical protein